MSERKQGHTSTPASVPKPKPTQSTNTPSTPTTVPKPASQTNSAPTPTPAPQSPTPPDTPTQPKLNPNAISVVDLAKLLSRVCTTEVTPEMIEEDIEAGMPLNNDGTISLVHYAAWLVQEMTQHERPS